MIGPVLHPLLNFLLVCMGPDACGLACRADVVMLDVEQEEPVSNGNSVHAAADKQGMNWCLEGKPATTTFHFVAAQCIALQFVLKQGLYVFLQHQIISDHSISLTSSMQSACVPCCSKATH